MADATTSTNPVQALDFNGVELALSDARNMAGILHRLLGKLERLPIEVVRGAPDLLALNEDDRNQLCFAAWKTVKMIEEVEEELDMQLTRLSPPADKAA